MDNSAPFMILGVHLKSDGYPNVAYRIAALQVASDGNVPEINFPFRAAPGEHSRGRVVELLRFSYAHVDVLFRYLLRRDRRAAYLPYPAVPLLLLFSLCPVWLRPRLLIADAFISLYDTVVNDRKLIGPTSLAARLLRCMEDRAYGAADHVVVDTEMNAAYFRRTFLRARNVIALPLSIDELYYRNLSPARTSETCRVLFVGTFVPLQGIEVIAAAALLLQDRGDIRFHLVGDGQTADAVRAVLSAGNGKNIDWTREWQSAEQVRAHIAGADLCLGIFGEGDKTQRVWPFKNYHYMAAGRALVTGDTECARSLTAMAAGNRPFEMVPCGDAAALASVIGKLASNPVSRSELAKSARRYFDAHLSSAHSIPSLRRLLGDTT